MRKHLLTAAMALAVLSAGILAGTRADAMTLGTPAGLGVAADRVDATENVQYVYGGRRHCWYPDGWHGPGWYWCGYRLRQGLGWGGPVGWHGWSYGPRGGAVVVGPRRYGPGPRRGGPGPHYHH
jgi:hypothetical protein